VAAGAPPEAAEDLVAALRGAPGAPAPPPAVPAGPGAPPPAGELRVDAGILDRVADGATQLRLMALGAGRVAERLDELARLAEEGVREAEPRQALAVLAAMLRRMAVEVEGDQRVLLRATEDQLEGTLGLQLLPLTAPLQGLARHARQLAESLGKEVEVEIAGHETRLDRRIARDLHDSLLHLVRNAVDHGLEAPDERERRGKARAGRLVLEASAHGPRVRLEIRDDGPGIDGPAVLRRAVASGLVEPAEAAAMGREESFRLLFRPGFSTRREVSELSGRGMGLDAVAAAVARVGGEVVLASGAGAGTRVAVEVPVARRGEEVLVLAVGSLRLALPASVVRGVVPLPGSAVVERDSRSLARLDGRLVPFVPLAGLWGETAAEPRLLVEATVAGQALAVAVDDVVGGEEVLVRPVPAVAGASPLVDGVALLASGEPVGVLSPTALVRGDLVAARRPAEARPAAARRARVLLVEDSRVTREMERRLLEDAGFTVVAAADAEEALERLGGEPFDCLVIDIEMPGMDGFELTGHLRATEHFAQLPIVVVSTRDRAEDRLRGLRAGADAYLTKQALDAGELVDLVRRLAGR
jgi:chemotaxis protein histidine kinase CheA